MDDGIELGECTSRGLCGRLSRGCRRCGCAVSFKDREGISTGLVGAVALVFKPTVGAGGPDDGGSLVVGSLLSLRLAILLTSAVVAVGTGEAVIVTFDFGLLSSFFLVGAGGLVLEVGEDRGEFDSCDGWDRGGL